MIRPIIGAGIFIVVPSEQSQRVYRKGSRTQNLRAAHGGATASGVVTPEHKEAIIQCSAFINALLPR
jgi:hypothetical protein